MEAEDHNYRRTARPPMWFVAAPALLFGYGVVRLFDGLDGEYGPGLAWTLGHLLFLAGMVLFGAVAVRLGRLVPATTTARQVTASVAVATAPAGIVAFVRVIVLDLVVGFLAADNAEMNMIRDDIGDFPGILPGAVWDLGPLLFMVGLLTLTIQLAVLHPQRGDGRCGLLVHYCQPEPAALRRRALRARPRPGSVAVRVGRQ